jgi:putative flippase GtrA
MIFVHVLMRWVFRHLSRIPRSTRSWLISLCGIAALLAMLLLWASMALGIYKLALGIWGIAVLIIYALVWSSPDERI